MDPNANLRDQEALVSLPRLQSYQRDRLRELRVALREWLRGGGFEPDWAACPTAARFYRRRGKGLPPTGKGRDLMRSDERLIAHTCRTHGGHRYTRCGVCDGEYCARIWARCPRVDWHPAHAEDEAEAGRRAWVLDVARRRERERSTP